MKEATTNNAPKVLMTDCPRFGRTPAQIQDVVVEGTTYEPFQTYELANDVPLQLAALIQSALLNVGDAAMFTITGLDYEHSALRGIGDWTFYREVTGTTPGPHGDRTVYAHAASGQVHLELKYWEPLWDKEDCQTACTVEMQVTAMANAQEAATAAEQGWHTAQLREFTGFLRFAMASKEHAGVFREAIQRISDPAHVAARVTRPECREAIATLAA